ncbi:uncharacterized protein LOC131664020 [Phymastichus coffea]|uniref:uncharacterized protein LOC131664020 n=1 Tax=Phymastichus coffea TaxID=108790 RepID=UPI00273AA7BF|nr:uncharacterized protein LOC131664020 [Phymastichus coffea]
MIQVRLSWWLEHNVKLPLSQFGFRKSRSCADNLSILTTKIYSGFTNGLYTTVAYLDVKSAFDDVDPTSLVYLLKDLGLPETICKFYYNLTGERLIYFNINGEITGPFVTRKGVPQGCVSSPTLYSISVSQLIYILIGCDCLQFADDIALIVTHKDPKVALKILERNLKRVNLFLQKIGLSLSLEKTNIVIHTNHKDSDFSNLSVTVDSIQIPVSNSAKFLGLTLDKNLSWSTHLNHIVKKISPSINIIRSLRTTWWGGHPRSLLLIYKSIVSAAIDYGLCCIPSNTNSFFEKINVLQRRALRFALGLRNTTPNRIVYAESQIYPLQLRQEKLAYNYIIRSFSTTNHPATIAISNLVDSLKKSSPRYIHNLPLLKAFTKLKRFQKKVYSSPIPPCYVFSLEAQQTESTIILDKGETIAKADNPPTEFIHQFSDLLQSHTPFYTDGSKKDTGLYVGLAIHSPDHGPDPLDLNLKFKIDPHNSIFSAEALAIQFTLELIILKKISKSIIFTDCLSALLCLTHQEAIIDSTHITIFRIKTRLLEILQNHQEVIFAWIPSHKGIPGNETADILAKQACGSGISPSNLIPHSDLRQFTNNLCRDKFKKFLTRVDVNKGVQYFQNYFSHSSKPWFNNTTLCRTQVVTTVRVRSNHYSLAYSLHRKNLVQSPLCPCGKDNEDLNHVYWSCERFDNHRKLLLFKLMKTKIFPPYTISQFLSDPKPSHIEILCKFLKSAEILL